MNRESQESEMMVKDWSNLLLVHKHNEVSTKMQRQQQSTTLRLLS